MNLLRERILSVLGRIGPQATWRLGRMAGVKTSEARREACRMEREGLLARMRHSTCNNIIWQLPPHGARGSEE